MRTISSLVMRCVHVALLCFIGGTPLPAQSLCTELAQDSTIVRVLFTEHHGSPFTHYGVNDQPSAVWYSFSMGGKDILQPFLHTFPDRKKHVQWIPAAMAGPTQQGPLNGSYILERGRYKAVFTFEKGFLARITTFIGHAPYAGSTISIVDLSVVNECRLPFLVQSTLLKHGAPFTVEHDLEMIGLVADCTGEWSMIPSIYPAYVKERICRK